MNKRLGVVPLAAIAGWSIAAVASANTDIVSDGDFSSPYGGVYNTHFSGGGVDPDGSPDGASQSLILSMGRHVLIFDLPGDLDGSPTTKTVNITVGGANQIYTYTVATNGRVNTRYTLETLNVTAAWPTTLTFTSRDSNSPHGPGVGGVDAPAVPEASTWALMLVGFATIGLALRRGWALKRELAALQSD